MTRASNFGLVCGQATLQHLPAVWAIWPGLSDRQPDGRLQGRAKALCYHRALKFLRKANSLVFKVDLHCHSTASDGLLPAAEVARRALQNGVELFSLTDHDDLGGLSAARSVVNEAGAGFVTGVEVSIEWGGLQIHVLGFNFDADDAALNAGLASIRSGRVNRAQRMAAELEKVGIPGCFEGAMRYAENPNLISRSHFARYLVEIGVCDDVRSVFESYIVPGKPGYVDHRWATLEESVNWITGAGGVASVAHPGRYKLTKSEMRRFLDEFRSVGGRAIEVVSGSHSAENVAVFSRIAREFGFMASCGSDYHGPGESYMELGALAPLPSDLVPVWKAF